MIVRESFYACLIWQNVAVPLTRYKNWRSTEALSADPPPIFNR